MFRLAARFKLAARFRPAARAGNAVLGLLLLGASVLPGWEQLAAQQALPQPVTNHDRDRAQRAFVAGGKAIEAHDLEAAVANFGDAARLDPTNRDYSAALSIARDNFATVLMQQALEARLHGDKATFRARMQQAASEDSRNPLVVEHREDLAGLAGPEASSAATPFDHLGPPVELSPNASGTHSFHLRLPEAEVLRQVLSAWGVVVSVDSSVGSQSIPFDADDVSFDQAMRMLTLATDSFAVPLDPRRALFALDTKENRSKYERLSIETLYLPGLSANEMSDVSNIARNLFRAQQVTLHEANSTLTLRAPQRQMQAFNYEVQELLAGHSQVLLQVDMYEVQRTYAVNEGAQLPQSTSLFNISSEVQSLISSNPSLVQQIISSGLVSPGNLEEIALALVASGQAGSTLLSQPFAYFGGGITATGVTLNSVVNSNLQLNDAVTRMLDRTELRLEDQQEGTLKVGERYPIVTSSFSNLATGATGIAGISSAGLSTTLQNLGVNLAALSSAATQSVPQVDYQDIGLNLTATPRVEGDGNISLKIHFEISSLSGQTLNSNPVINNRQSDSILSVGPGEQTVLVSQLTNQESTTLIGYPFLSEIPGFSFGTNREVSKTHDALVIVITPRLVRLTHKHPEGALVLLPAHS